MRLAYFDVANVGGPSVDAGLPGHDAITPREDGGHGDAQGRRVSLRNRPLDVVQVVTVRAIPPGRRRVARATDHRGSERDHLSYCSRVLARVFACDVPAQTPAHERDRLVVRRDRLVHDGCQPLPQLPGITRVQTQPPVAHAMAATPQVGLHDPHRARTGSEAGQQDDRARLHPLLGCMAGWFVSLYRMPHLKFEGNAVYTNKAPACAMQGYGNPQVSFAVESQMDIIAEKLGIDPIDIRLKNYVGLGETFWGQGPTVRSVIRSCGVEEMLLRGKEIIGWEKRLPPQVKTQRFRRGIGVGRGFHTSGTGAPTPGEVIDYSTAMVKINEDGSVDCSTALMCHGGGTLEAGAKIVAEELGVPLDNVGISPSDTRSTGYDVCTHATRGVYCGGASLQRAAQKAKKRLLEFASRLIDVNPEALRIYPEAGSGQGVIYLPGTLAKNISIGEVAKMAQLKGWGTILGVVSHRQVNCPPCFVTNFIEVEVDTQTGRIRPTRAVAAVDAGTVINPDLAAGQLEGGLCRGVGLALLEDTDYDPQTGELTCGGFFTDYKMFTAQDMPPLEDISTFFAKTYEPSGPFGAKGIGEAANNATAGAVANAVYNALGIRFKAAPITPERVLAALKQKSQIEEDDYGKHQNPDPGV